MNPEATPPQTILAADALAGIRLGLSVSESPDLMRLGLVETHLRVAIAEIARCILVSGGHLAYGGHLKPDGYTSFLAHELERYGRRDRPLKVMLPWTEHRRMRLSALEEYRRSLGLCGEIICLDVNGHMVDASVGRNEDPTYADESEQISSLTALRHFMTENTRGRVLIGGRRDDFHGTMPGLLEEAILTIQCGQPIYLAGGFGGITLDIARASGLDGGRWPPSLAGTPHPDTRVAQGMSRLIEALRSTDGESFKNGLSMEENLQLASCHRPSAIAALVSLGLGRRFIHATD